MNLHDAAFHREFAAFLLEQPRAVHQLALVDLALGFRRIEQRHRRQCIVALAAFRRRLRGRFRVRERQRRRRHRHLRWLGRRERSRRLRCRDDCGCRFLRVATVVALERARHHARGLGRETLGRHGIGIGTSVPAFAFGNRRFGCQCRRLQCRVARGGRPAHRRFADDGRGLSRVLGNHFAALLLAAALLAPLVERVEAAGGAAAHGLDDRGEESPERELRRHDDRQEDQRQQDDHRAGAIQVLGHFLREELAGIAAGGTGLAGDVERAEGQAEKRAQTAEQQSGAGRLGAGGVEASAPEIIPADHHHHGGDEIRRVAEQLERQLGEKRADPAGEVDRRGVRTGAEEPDRIGWLVAGQRHNPDQGGGEQRDADEFAGTPGNSRSTHVSDLHDDGQHEGPPS